MLFFFFIGACLSLNQDTLQPITSVRPSESLISVAKTNPRVLVEMLDGADPETINNIVAILRSLVQDGLKEMQDMVEAVQNATKLRDAKRVELTRVRALEGTAESELRRVTLIKAEKEGIHNTAQDAYDAAEPNLSKEINTLNKVLDMLEDLLLQNEPEQKELIELGSSEKGKAYLKLIANVQANPEKLKKIIGFVGTLRSQAESTLEGLRQKVVVAKRVLDQAVGVVEKAKVALTTAKQVTASALDAVNRAEGSLKAATQAYNTRKPILTSENKTLNEVIDLLLSTADNATPTPQSTD